MTALIEVLVWTVAYPLAVLAVIYGTHCLPGLRRRR